MKNDGWAVPKKCADSHPRLPIVVDGVTYTVGGGTCLKRPPKGTDVFVGLDRGMASTPLELPWNPGVALRFDIADMQAPKNPAEFYKLIEWLAQQLRDERNVFIGCIGGHGRTGTVLAALVKHMTDEVEAIQYVREKYCTRAVESSLQIAFLMKHWGIATAQASKESSWASSGGGKVVTYRDIDKYAPPWHGGNVTSLVMYNDSGESGDRITPVSSTGLSIHGNRRMKWED